MDVMFQTLLDFLLLSVSVFSSNAFKRRPSGVPGRPGLAQQNQNVPSQRIGICWPFSSATRDFKDPKKSSSPRMAASVISCQHATCTLLLCSSHLGSFRSLKEPSHLHKHREFLAQLRLNQQGRLSGTRLEHFLRTLIRSDSFGRAAASVSPITCGHAAHHCYVRGPLHPCAQYSTS